MLFCAHVRVASKKGTSCICTSNNTNHRGPTGIRNKVPMMQHVILIMVCSELIQTAMRAGQNQRLPVFSLFCHRDKSLILSHLLSRSRKSAWQGRKPPRGKTKPIHGKDFGFFLYLYNSIITSISPCQHAQSPSATVTINRARTKT